MDKDDLLKILGDDEDGLLTTKQKISSEQSSNDRLTEKFLEINNFFREYGREPQPGKDIGEMMLHSRLAGIRQDPQKASTLQEFDEYNLLARKSKIDTIEDVFQDDDLGLLSNAEDSIYDLKHVPSKKEIANLPDYIARRSQCADFPEFEHLFKQCQRDLVSGRRTLMPFKRGSLINKQDFFVLKGSLVYVAEEGSRHQTADKNTYNARLRCIFENGTESDLLLRSLAAALYKEDGQRVSASTEQLYKSVKEISEDDQETGYVYVLKSLSEKQEISSLKHLYKIGFCRGPVEQRIKNAAQEATYLMAPVSIVTAYHCYNLNPQKLEALLHTFFGDACLNVEVTDLAGQKCVPKEWFIAPRAVITQAIELLISGEIVEYKYNSFSQSIEKRGRS